MSDVRCIMLFIDCPLQAICRYVARIASLSAFILQGISPLREPGSGYARSIRNHFKQSKIITIYLRSYRIEPNFLLSRMNRNVSTYIAMPSCHTRLAIGIPTLISKLVFAIILNHY